MIVMRCSSCGGQINATPDLAGSFIVCPSCGNETLIPTMQVPPSGAGVGAGSTGAGGAGGRGGARHSEADAWKHRAPPTYPSSLNFGSVIPPGQPIPACSRVVYIVLAIVLGNIGIHNFVAGRTGVATAQLITTVTCIVLLICTIGFSAIGIVAMSIWAIIEAVTVTEDGRGVRMN